MNQHLLGSIHQVLSQLGIGFNVSNRGLRLNFANTLLSQQLFIQHIQGNSAINEGLSAELICLSTDAFIALKTFIGQAVTIEQATDQGKLHSITGIITASFSGQSDGGFAIYKLKLQDSFSSLLSTRRNSRVFMQKSVPEITQILFAEWQQRSELFAKTILLDNKQLSRSYDVRPFTMQSNESDYDFLTRLWRSEGVNWFIDNASPYQHILKLFDDNRTLTQLPLSTIRFHRSDATEQRDTITALTATRQLKSSQIHLQRWDQQHGSMNEQAHLSTAKQSHAYSSTALNLEQAWHVGSASLGDLDGQDTSTLPHDGQLTRLGELLIKRQEFDNKIFYAVGSVRDVKVGYWFSLNGHAELDQHSADEREFLITSLSFYAKNNLPKALDERIVRLIEQSHWMSQLPGYTDMLLHQTQMTLIRRDVTMVPFYNPLVHVAKAAPMRARVVGTQGEQVHVDVWGRIKVQFLFSRPQDNTHSGGAGSSGTDSDSAWVDVLTPWAGGDESSYGARFLPRAGELVVIDFFEDNADRPFVLGRIHEGSRPPAQFDHQGKLPDTRHLSGIKSQEVSGSGFNQLRFDDTSGQISAQLASSHGASQLNLGNLVHPRSSEEGKPRGEGFELRTDQFGALRAGKGLLVSTHAQNKASKQMLDIDETLKQIQNHYESNEELADNLQEHKAHSLEALATLKSCIDELTAAGKDQEVKTLKQAILILTGASDLVFNAKANIYTHAEANLLTTANANINYTAQQNMVFAAEQKLGLFSAQDDMQLLAAKGKLEILAHSKNIDLIANEVVKIISAKTNVEITAAEEITLNANGSQIKINGNGVFVTTPKLFKAKAGQHVFEGGAAAQIPKLTWAFKEKTKTCMQNAADSHEAFVKFD